MKQKAVNFSSMLVVLLSSLLISGCGGSSSSSDDGGGSGAPTLSSVGKKLFFDANLSSNSNQSCGDCHAPSNGFADPDVSQAAPVSEGSVSGEFGNRNAPTAAYANFIPDFVKISSPTATADGSISNYQGGQFLDGRAVDLIEQAKGPFLNPVEMNNGTGLTGRTNVVNKVAIATYADEFKTLFGNDIFTDVDGAYDNIAEAIAAFESSDEVNPFTSKFDAWRAGQATLTASEMRGFELFRGTKAKCANCHALNNPVDESLFTDFNYFNIGTPANPANPIYTGTPGFIDGGLGDSPALTDPVEQAAEQGKFRTPTLRNIEVTAPYMHNGVFATLEEVIRHYDITVANYIADPVFVAANQPEKVPEVTTNIAEEMKTFLNLDNDNSDGITDYEDLVNFMNTLTDGYNP